MMHGAIDPAVIDFLKSVSTSTRFFEFATEEQLANLPRGVAAHIEELEDILSRLSLEAEALLWRVGQGHALYPNLKGGKR
jgi:hypothetical protein